MTGLDDLPPMLRGVRLPAEYEPARDEVRATVAAQLPDLRIPLGDGTTLALVDPAHLRLAVEEQLRADRATEPDAAAALAARLAHLLPLQRDELVALLLVDAADPAEQSEALERLAASAPEVRLTVEGNDIAAVRDVGSGDDPVAVLRFRVPPRTREHLVADDCRADLRIGTGGELRRVALEGRHCAAIARLLPLDR